MQNLRRFFFGFLRFFCSGRRQTAENALFCPGKAGKAGLRGGQPAAGKSAAAGDKKRRQTRHGLPPFYPQSAGSVIPLDLIVENFAGGGVNGDLVFVFAADKFHLIDGSAVLEVRLDLRLPHLRFGQPGALERRRERACVADVGGLGHFCRRCCAAGRLGCRGCRGRAADRRIVVDVLLYGENRAGERVELVFVFLAVLVFKLDLVVGRGVVQLGVRLAGEQLG